MIENIKLLDRVIATDKNRALSMIQMYAQGFTESEVGEVYKLSKARISQILKPNKALCNEITISLSDEKKARRLRLIDKHIRLKSDVSKKDVMDWIDCERKEIEGEKGVNVHVGDTIIQTPHAVIFSAIKEEKKPDECQNSRL